MHKFLILLILILEIIAETDDDDKERDLEASTISTTQHSIEEKESFSKCFGEIGCVNTDESWFHSKYRPINLKPLDRDVIKTEFVLIRKNRSSVYNEIFSQILTANKESIKNTGYSSGKFLFVLIHDFTSSGYGGWIKHISRVLKARTKKCNIISVDWHGGAGPPYDQAIANARVVALEIGAMLKYLKDDHKLTMDQVHVIGHGVGAHIAGYVGRAAKPQKITGLDPSGPRFEGMPLHVRLDETDGNYVEVLHTDAWDYTSQGLKEISGHTDFFINDAELQPGCPEKQTNHDLLAVTRGLLNEGEILPGCSHKRSYKYYIESFEVEECTFLGIKCSSYADFKQGKCSSCGHDCRTFGLVTYETPNNGSYFLQTAASKPYCLYQYRATVQIKGGKSAYFGWFEFILTDKSHYISRSSPLEPRDFKPGGDNVFVFYAGEPRLGKIIEGKVGWKEKANKFCLFNCKQAIEVEKISIENINSFLRKSKPVSLCPEDGLTEIENGDYQHFILC